MPKSDIRALSNLEFFAPKIQVRFHTDRGNFESSTQAFPGGQEDTLISCQTFKDIGQPAGTFVLHLADYARYDTLLNPMDVCTIKVSVHTPSDPKTGNISESRDAITHATMIGLIDSVRRKRLIDPMSGKPTVFCEIRGRDFGKLFVKHQIRYLPWVQDQLEGETMVEPILSMFRSLVSGISSGGDIDFLVVNNLKRMFSQAVDMTFPFNGKKLNLTNCISYRAQSKLGVIPFNLPLNAQEGSLWQILQNFSGYPFNEMWVDTINNPERVISAKESSSVSSPLRESELASNRTNAQQYINQQTGADKELTEKIFGKNAENITVAEKYRGSPDNCDAHTMMFLRRVPFDQIDWDALPRYGISNADIVEQDLGTSDHETYNYFWVYPLLAVPQEITMKSIGILPLLLRNIRQFNEGPGNELGNARPIMISGNSETAKKYREIARENAFEKFGFCPLEVKTRMWRWADSEGTGDSLKTANNLTHVLNNWYRHNSILKSGSMTIKGAPDLHVGNVLVNVDDQEEYYVEGISNNYIQYQPMTTTVMLTRGQPTKNSGRRIEWGNIYRDFCSAPPIPAGRQVE